MRAFLRLLDARVPIAITADLAPRLGPGVLDSLRRAGWLRSTGQDGMEEVSIPDVVRALRVLYAAPGRGLRIPAELSVTPVLIGWIPEGGVERELVLCSGGRGAMIHVVSRARPTLALLPRKRALTKALRSRHAPGARIAVEVLEETLVVRDGRLARAATFAPDPPDLAAQRDPKPAPARPGDPPFHGASSWSEVCITVAGANTLRFSWAGRSRIVSAIDVGMAAVSNRNPWRTWELLQAFCEGDGVFKSWRFGNARATKKTVSRLRIALRALFGLDADPFLPYRRGHGWQACFQAGERLPEDQVQLSPGARAMLERAGKRR